MKKPPRYAIVPGESVGPFKLGMTRDEIDACRQLARHAGVDFPLVNIGEESREEDFLKPGVYFHYDAAGKCSKIDALFAYKPRPPVFTLLGHVVNGMTDKQAASILRAIASDARFSYASLHSRSAGLRATKWEASDDHIMSIVVMPKQPD